MKIDVSELNRLSADLGKVAAESLPLVRAVVQKVCADTKRDAQMFCPVDTGNLRSSISYETQETRSGAWGEVGPTASYGAYVEFGTSRMGPQAFMGPAFDRNAINFEQAVSRLADKAL